MKPPRFGFAESDPIAQRRHTWRASLALLLLASAGVTLLLLVRASVGRAEQGAYVLAGRAAARVRSLQMLQKSVIGALTTVCTALCTSRRRGSAHAARRHPSRARPAASSRTESSSVEARPPAGPGCDAGLADLLYVYVLIDLRRRRNRAGERYASGAKDHEDLDPDSSDSYDSSDSD